MCIHHFFSHLLHGKLSINCIVRRSNAWSTEEFPDDLLDDLLDNLLDNLLDELLLPVISSARPVIATVGRLGCFKRAAVFC